MSNCKSQNQNVSETDTSSFDTLVCALWARSWFSFSRERETEMESLQQKYSSALLGTWFRK